MDSDMDFELLYKTGRSTYPLTYSCAYFTKFAMRESFVAAVLECFPDKENSKVVQWSCCKGTC